MSEKVLAWVGLGANLGNACETLSNALQAINALPHTELLKTSSFYRSAPVDATGPDFINAVACFATMLSPLDFLHALQSIELQNGRQRPYYHAPRTLDLDLLLHGHTVLNTPELTLPHPAMHERAFVLQPLVELENEIEIPQRGRAVDCLKLLSHQRIERLH